MRSELLFNQFTVSESPGLDTFDPRLSDVMAAVQNSDFTRAADLAADLLSANECDIRLTGYLLFDDYTSQGSAALPTAFRALSAVFDENWEAFGPLKNKEKHALATVNWLINTLSKVFEKAMSDASERWTELVSGVDLEAASELVAAYNDFNTLFEERVEALAEKNANARNNLRRIFDRIFEIHDAEAQQAVQEEPEAPPEDETIDQEDGSTRAPQGDGLQVSGSAHLAQLIAKMNALNELTQTGRFDRAAIVVSDIQEVLANFDPILYFPELFSDYNRVLAENVDNIWEHLEMRGSPRWDAFEAYYKSDLDGFLKL